MTFFVKKSLRRTSHKDTRFARDLVRVYSNLPLGFTGESDFAGVLCRNFCSCLIQGRARLVPRY